MSDVFVWPMSAVSHKQSVDVLRQDIIAAYTASPQGPVPIKLIFALLPLDVDGEQDAVARGDIELAGDDWANVAADELDLTIRDPVMDEFYVALPAEFRGRVALAGDTLSVAFDPPLELEIPQLAELGVDRSKFQQLLSIDVSPSLSLSKLREADGEERETWIQAFLVPGAAGEIPELSNASSASLLGSGSGSGCGGGDPNDPNWYVYQRTNDRLCFVHYGQIIYGGDLAYDYRFGPATQDRCNAWVSKNCEF